MGDRRQPADADGPAKVPMDLAEAVPEEEPFSGDLEGLLVSEAESPPEAEAPPLEDELETPEADWQTDLDDVASDVDEEPDALAADPLGAVEQEAPPPAPAPTRAAAPARR